MLSSVRNTMRVLKSFAFDASERSLTELSILLELPKSTIFKILKTMVEEGFVERDDQSGRYRLGLRIQSLHYLIFQHAELTTVATPHLRYLARYTRLAAHITSYHRGQVVWLKKEQADQTFEVYSRIGRRAPAYAPASGKAIAAFLPDNEVQHLLHQEWYAMTPYTHIDKQHFLLELATIRENGFSIQRDEVDLGVTSIALPLFQNTVHPIASISLAGASHVLTDSRMRFALSAMKEVAQDLSLCL